MILIIYTGGTIGMRKDERGFLVPNLDSVKERILRIADDFGCEISFRVLQPLIDSSSLTPALWLRLGKLLVDERDEYDSFVILHGTDTMAFTAAFLNLMMCGFGRPIILTGSIFPFSSVVSDAPDNVADSFSTVLNLRLCGVYLVFGRRVWRSSHVKKVDSYSVNAFCTPGIDPVFDFEMGVNYSGREDIGGPFVLQSFDPDLKVVSLMFVPGFTLGMICDVLESGYFDGIVFQSYGLGNIPADARLLFLVSKIIEGGCVVVNCSQNLRSRVDMSVYASGAVLANLGVWSARNMSFESTLAKLYLTLSKKDLSLEDKKVLWDQEWADEFRC